MYVLHEMILKRKLIFFQAFKNNSLMYLPYLPMSVNMYLICFTEPLEEALGHFSTRYCHLCVLKNEEIILRNCWPGNIKPVPPSTLLAVFTAPTCPTNGPSGLFESL